MRIRSSTLAAMSEEERIKALDALVEAAQRPVPEGFENYAVMAKRLAGARDKIEVLTADRDAALARVRELEEELASLQRLHEMTLP